MEYSFQSYCEFRDADEWDRMITESAGDVLNQDVTVLVRAFLQKLGDRLPQGLRTLGTNAITAARKALLQFRSQGEGIDPSQPVDRDAVARAIRVLGLSGDEADPNLVAWNLKMFNKNCSQVMKQGTEIDPATYYQQFRNYLNDPSLNVDSKTMLRNTPNPSRVVSQVANQIKSTIRDPQTIQIIDKTLQEVLSDMDVRQLVTYNRGTREGQRKASDLLGRYGFNNADLTRELGVDPELRKRYNHWQRVKRQRFKKPIQGPGIAPGTEREPGIMPANNPNVAAG